MAFTDDIPAINNTVASDIIAIEANLAYLKDCFEQLFTGWSDTDYTGLIPTVDTIAEKTGDAGVTVDGVLFKDGVRYGQAVASGSFAGTPSGDYAVTGVGFTPKLVKFTVARSNARSTHGYMTATAQGSVGTTAPVISGILTATTYHSASYCAANIYDDGEVDFGLAFKSMDADGFTVTINPSQGSTTVYWWAIG